MLTCKQMRRYRLHVLFFVAVGHDYVSGDKLIDLLEHGTVEVFGCMIWWEKSIILLQAY